MFDRSGTLVEKILGCACILLMSPSVYAFKIVSFEGAFTRWHKNRVSYVVDSQGSDDFNEKGCDSAGPCVTVEKIMARSFSTWEKVPGIDIQFDAQKPKTIGKTGYDGENSIVFIEKGWQSLSFAPPPSALAVTISTYRTSNKEILDSDIHFNGENFHWASIDTADEEYAGVVDIQNIATHEIGHFLGMDHSSEDIFEPINQFYLATMFFASGPGEIFRRELNQDDQHGTLNLYHGGDPGEPRIAEVYPDEIDAQVASTALLQISGDNFQPYSTAQLIRKGDAGDVVARVLTTSDAEMNLELDLFGLPSGEYDLMVANSYDRIDVFEGAITIAGSTYFDDTNESSFGSSGGGCALNTQRNQFSNMILLLLPLLLIVLARLNLSLRMQRMRLRIQKVKRAQTSGLVPWSLRTPKSQPAKVLPFRRRTKISTDDSAERGAVRVDT